MPRSPSSPSPEELIELAALADGTLAADRRAALEARIAGSPELQAALDRQRQALVAARALDDEPLPERLRSGVAGLVARERRPRRRRGLLPLGAAAGAVAALLVVVLAVGGSDPAPAVADVARIAVRDLPGPAPAALPGGTLLDVQVGEITFPDWRRLGWRASGVRRTTVDGRDVTTVEYRRGGQRIGYAIVDESALDEPATATRSVRRGVVYRGLRVDGQATVTWRRAGRTCVLAGDAAPAELLRLASWRDGGSLVY